MAKRYRVKVYDCSFIQDYVSCYEKTFSTYEQAYAYANSLMVDFGDMGRYEYSSELSELKMLDENIGIYVPFGFFEFDCASFDGDLEELFDMDDEELAEFSYHNIY